ncbi:MAG: ABC transporter permease [Acidobacteriaceae bacterium]|nr:ABC transporter permease [Acidobacteriaceae bacterium]
MNPGFSPQNVLTASVRLSGPGYAAAAHQTTFFQNVLRRIAASPQVLSAAAASDLPFTFPSSARVVIEGRPVPETEKQAMVGYFAVSPGYFSAAQIPLREGREFTTFDKAGSPPVVIVNQAFAEKFFQHENPLGRRIHLSRENLQRAATGPEWNQIVGVIGNVNEFLGQLHPRPHVFEPFLQQPQGSMSLLVRLRTEPSAFAASLRQAVWSVDKNQPVTNTRTMYRVIQDAGQGDDLMAELMGAFAGIALVMAALGIYGLISYLVARRAQEIGVRMALGASQHEVMMLILRNSMSLTLIGVAMGLLFSLPLPTLTAALFTDFHVRGGWITGGTALAVTVVALASSYVPAQRASKVDPLGALRGE